MTIDEAVLGKALKVLDAVGRVLGTRRAQGAGDLASPPTAAIKSAAYASTINAAGRQMRRDCRDPLRARTMDAKVEFDFETPTLSLEQRLECFKRSESYAAECRRLWRKTSSSS